MASFEAVPKPFTAVSAALIPLAASFALVLSVANIRGAAEAVITLSWIDQTVDAAMMTSKTRRRGGEW